jgi:hypothetical protein
MAKDAFYFYKRDVKLFIIEKLGKDEELLIESENVLNAWDWFKANLLKIHTKKSFAIGGDNLEKILAISLNYHQPHNTILDIAQEVYEKTQEEIHALARKVDARKPWEQIIYKDLPPISTQNELMELFKNEIINLRNFFRSQDIIPFPSEEKVSIQQTQSYLRSLMATASYRAPLTGDIKGHGIFYITPGKEDLKLISAHCPYLSAHETYPGHHILDNFRIHHDNPIRCQIESPLFYEGWACYAEKLLDELGYIKNPRKQLIQLKRQLWRNLRAILDIKLHTGNISLEQAAKEIENLGYSSNRAQRQAQRFSMTPGYQLCYFVGMQEILNLKEKFSLTSGLKEFHFVLLTGGELPFHLVEKRFEALRH